MLHPLDKLLISQLHPLNIHLFMNSFPSDCTFDEDGQMDASAESEC